MRTPAIDRVARDGAEEAANHVPFFPPKFKTWVEALGEHGYFAGMTGKGSGPGVANDAQGKPRQMTGRPFLARKAAPPASGMSANDYAGTLAISSTRRRRASPGVSGTAPTSLIASTSTERA